MYLFDPILSARAFAGIGLEPASWDEMADVHALAQDMIGGEMADIETLRRVQAHMGAVVYIYREGEEITGFLASLLLTDRGQKALIGGRFNGLDPSPVHLCRPGEKPVAAYGWGYAGRTRRACAAVIKGALLGRRELCPELPFFTRGATADGARLLSGRLECQPFPLERPGLYWSPPISPSIGAAA